MSFHISVGPNFKFNDWEINSFKPFRHYTHFQYDFDHERLFEKMYFNANFRIGLVKVNWGLKYVFLDYF